MHNDRYIHDALYGRIQLPDHAWAIALTPEVQRLREVRLCNINSLSLTGGANINRYEHVLGTAYLAYHCAETWPTPLPPDGDNLLVQAALTHDIGSAAFGHSVQYLLDEAGFEHESFREIIGSWSANTSDGFNYAATATEPFYFDVYPQLPELLSDREMHLIGDLVQGKGRLGPVLNGTMDIDNIDNIFRLAYHIGILTNSETDIPLQLARSISSDRDGLMIPHSERALVEKWYEVRHRLYTYLLLNPDEFSAKCMLTEALRRTTQDKLGRFHDWKMVDYELLSELAKVSDEVHNIVSRLMIGKLFGCVAIIEVKQPRGRWQDRRAPRDDLEQALENEFRRVGDHRLRSCQVCVHVIRDKGKTRRAVEFQDRTGTTHTVGEDTDRALIGVFLTNTDLSSNHMNEDLIESNDLTDIAHQKIRQRAEAAGTRSVPLYSEHELATVKPAVRN